MSHRFQRLVSSAALALWAVPALAQTPVLDPRVAEFVASPDHARLNTQGQPVVSRYDLEFYFAGAEQPFQTSSLGKPAPDSSNIIRVNLATVLAAFPPPGVTYEARVAAVGPAGAGRSLPSNQFAFTDPCAATLAPTGISVGAAATAGSVTVSIAAGCAWSISSNEPWVTFSGSSTRTGSGVVSYSVAANTTTSGRSATLTIAGQSFVITQAAGCTYGISPTSISIASGARTGAVAVSTSAGCGWTASSAVPWITIASGGTGSGSGSVSYSVAANASITPRTGTMTVAGHTFTVTQAGVPCDASLSPSGVVIAAEAATGSFGVAIPSGCTWTAADNASWVSITGGASGTGSGTVSFSVAANGTLSTRTASITVAGQTFTIEQAGVTCAISISPTASAPTHLGGSSTVSVSANAPACGWTAASTAAWITITSGGSGSGNGTVAYTVAPNPSAGARTGGIDIAGQTLTVTQAGVPCSYGISPTQASLTSTGASGTVSVTAPAGCSWSASSPVAWVTIGGGSSGSGNGTVAYTVASNFSTSPRSATLTIAGQSFAISQAGLPCTYTLQPTGASVPAISSTGSVAVQTLGGCAWTASSGAPWVTITGGQSGTGTGTVSYSVAANTTTTPRTGTLTVAGQPFTISQAGGSCTFTVAPSSQAFSPAGGTGTVSITTQGNCSWQAAAGAAWITIDGAGSGTGSGSFTYRVAASSDPAARSGTIAVGGRVVTISQAAACNYTLSPESVSLGAETSSGSFAVSTGPACSWTAVSSAPWLALTGATSGTGNGAVPFRADANTGAAPRTATVTAGGRTFTVTQAAPPCTFALSTTSLAVSALASTATVTVTAGAGCAWTASSAAPWITVTSGAAGAGNGTVSLSIAAHSGSTPRTGTVTIAGQAVTVTQNGAGCTASLSPAGLSAGADASQGSVAVTTGTGCAWTAASNSPWLALTSAGNGTGPGTVTFSIDANGGSAGRLGSLTIAGRTFFVTQAGRSCTFAIDPQNVALPSEGGADTIAVSASAGCTWTASTASSWIAIQSGGSGSGDGTVAFTVAPNPTASSRSGTIAVAGRIFSITQAGACTYTISPLSVSVGTGAASSNVFVFTGSGCTWTAASLAPWISVSAGASGTGAGLVTLSIAANSSSSSRTGNATIAGQTFTVNQGGCAYNVSPSSAAVPASGGIKSAFVSTTAGCGWTASSDSAWLTLSGAGSGSGTSWVTYSVAANANTLLRTGALTIAGKTLAVTQAAAPCTYTVTPLNAAVPNTGGMTTFVVSSPSNCAWTAGTAASWLSLTSATTGFGDGTVMVQAAPNPSIFPRSAIVSIAGKVVLVNQKVIVPPSPPQNLRIAIP